MISIFLISLLILNLSDKYFLEGKYHSYLNIFGGIISILFLFLPGWSPVVLLETKYFDLYAVIFYIAIKATFSLGLLANKKEPLDLEIKEIIALLLFSLNSPELKGLIVIITSIPMAVSFHKTLWVRKFDFFLLLTLFSSLISWDLSGYITAALLFVSFPVYFYTSKGKKSQAKLLFLVSFLCAIKSISLGTLLAFSTLLAFDFIREIFYKSDINRPFEIFKNLKWINKINTSLLLRIDRSFEIQNNEPSSSVPNKKYIKNIECNYPGATNNVLAGAFIFFFLISLWVVMRLLNA